MEKESSYKIAAIILLVILFLLNFRYQGVKRDNLRLQYSLYEYESALNQANENIEEANSIIEDAQYNAWSSYDDMGDALDNLYTVDTVSEPY